MFGNEPPSTLMYVTPSSVIFAGCPHAAVYLETRCFEKAVAFHVCVQSRVNPGHCVVYVVAKNLVIEKSGHV